MAAALSTHLGDVQMPGPLVAAAARAGPLQQRDQLHGGQLGPVTGHVTRDTGHVTRAPVKDTHIE